MESFRTYEFGANQDILHLKEFPITKLPALTATLSMYGVVRKDDKILLQGDYSKNLTRGRDGIRQSDGRFVWPFVAIQWIPTAERKHEEFCFVYNLYGENETFLGHRRCDSTFIIKRKDQ